MVRRLLTRIDMALMNGQVDEGETQIINVRETDGRLGPLVYTLVALGCITLVTTAVFWWLTRPSRVQAPTTVADVRPEGDQ